MTRRDRFGRCVGPITQRALQEVQYHEGIGADGVYGVVTASTLAFPGENAPCGHL